MPPAAKRNSGVILFDVNSSNKDHALLTLLKICTHKWLSASKDTYRLILSNTKTSRNVAGYKNLYDTNITNMDPQPILNCVEEAKAEQGDWLDAILLGIHHVKEAYDLPGIITLQILYITKLDGCSQTFDQKKIKQIITDLQEYNIYLYIIGPEVELPYTLTNEHDIRDAMKEIKIENKNVPALSAAEKIVSSTDNSVICNFKLGIHIFFAFKNPAGTQPWKVPLSFGSQLEVPVSTVRIYKKDPPFKLTAKGRSFHYVLQEDESVEVPPEDIVRGIVRHGKFVKVEEREMFKVEGPRSFSVLGFTKKENVPEIYMHGDGSYFVLPDPEKSVGSCQFIYKLVDVLAEQGKYAIARRVYNANNKPKFCVLIPQPHLVPKCFVMSELAYADDVKDAKIKFDEPKATAAKKTDSEEDEVTRFLKSLDIYGEDPKVNVPLGPMLMLDSSTSKLANETMKKYLNRDFNFDDLEFNLMEEETNEFSDALRESWPVKNTNADDDEDMI